MASNFEDIPQGFSGGVTQVVRVKPDELTAPNENDVRSFLHRWFADFDHARSAEHFLEHFDDADMSFDMDGKPVATDHASFREWYADALDHIPWDFHDVLAVTVTGTHGLGWTVQFILRWVGEWRDERDSQELRPFNRLLRFYWKVEHDGERFLIRRYDIVTLQNTIPH